jgi:hypothetical protein
MTGNNDSRFRILVEVKAAHRSHKWTRPTMRTRTRHPPLESALPVNRASPRSARTFGFGCDVDGFGHHVGGCISIHVISLPNQRHVVGCWGLWLLIKIYTDVIES